MNNAFVLISKTISKRSEMLNMTSHLIRSYTENILVKAKCLNLCIDMFRLEFVLMAKYLISFIL